MKYALLSLALAPFIGIAASNAPTGQLILTIKNKTNASFKIASIKNYSHDYLYAINSQTIQPNATSRITFTRNPGVLNVGVISQITLENQKTKTSPSNIMVMDYVYKNSTLASIQAPLNNPAFCLKITKQTWGNVGHDQSGLQIQSATAAIVTC